MNLSAPRPPREAWPCLQNAVLARACHAEVSADPPGAGKPAPGARQRRARDHLAGRLAASRALRALTGHAPEIGRGTDGAPMWPADVVGAISHSGGRAVALAGSASDHAGLGIDLETIAPHDGIAALVLGPDEMARLGAVPDALTLTLAFSAKESLFKALYPRVRWIFGFDAAALLSIGDGTGQMRLRHALGPWAAGAIFRFRWTETGGQVLTALSAPALPQALSVAPPST